VTAISFAKNLKALVRGSKTILIVAPKRRFKKLPRLLGKRLDDLAMELAKDVSPGDLGGSGSTLTRTDPRTLAVGVLPDRFSRHNSPTRAESIRRVVAAAANGRGKTGIIVVVDDPSHALAAVNAVGRALPTFSAKNERRKSRVQVMVVGPDGKQLELEPRTTTTMKYTRAMAELVDTPPTELNPAEFSRRAHSMLAELDHVTVEEIAGDDLLTHGLGGIHAVGRAAVDAPRMIVATYTPPDAPKSGRNKPKHFALVGKGVCYDTGGLNIKTGGNMSGMKCDMGGAAAVLGAFCVLASTGCAHQVSVLVCLAENAVGPKSYKPDDIITVHSGKTIEINNTDAEGRMLLADGVSWAARELNADVVIDAATLTGAQLISTGVLHAAVMSNDDALEETFVAQGKISGDLCHPLIFAPEFLKKEFRSVVADMRNSVASRMNAQSSCAAQFVYWQIEDTKARWLHIDLAGPAFPSDRATGYGVALISSAVLAS
jgi:probable aminopeptidase NPEPL1